MLDVLYEKHQTLDPTYPGFIDTSYAAYLDIDVDGERVCIIRATPLNYPKEKAKAYLIDQMKEAIKKYGVTEESVDFEWDRYGVFYKEEM